MSLSNVWLVLIYCCTTGVLLGCLIPFDIHYCKRFYPSRQMGKVIIMFVNAMRRVFAAVHINRARAPSASLLFRILTTVQADYQLIRLYLSLITT